jgi:hypothetical protein
MIFKFLKQHIEFIGGESLVAIPLTSSDACRLA